MRRKPVFYILLSLVLVFAAGSIYSFFFGGGQQSLQAQVEERLTAISDVPLRVTDYALAYQQDRYELYLFVTDQDTIGNFLFERNRAGRGGFVLSASLLPAGSTQAADYAAGAAREMRKAWAYGTVQGELSFSDGPVTLPILPDSITDLPPVTLTRADGSALTLYLACANLAE